MKFGKSIRQSRNESEVTAGYDVKEMLDVDDEEEIPSLERIPTAREFLSFDSMSDDGTAGHYSRYTVPDSSYDKYLDGVVGIAHDYDDDSGAGPYLPVNKVDPEEEEKEEEDGNDWFADSFDLYEEKKKETEHEVKRKQRRRQQSSLAGMGDDAIRRPTKIYSPPSLVDSTEESWDEEEMEGSISSIVEENSSSQKKRSASSNKRRSPSPKRSRSPNRSIGSKSSSHRSRNSRSVGSKSSSHRSGSAKMTSPTRSVGSVSSSQRSGSKKKVQSSSRSTESTSSSRLSREEREPSSTRSTGSRSSSRRRSKERTSSSTRSVGSSSSHQRLSSGQSISSRTRSVQSTPSSQRVRREKRTPTNKEEHRNLTRERSVSPSRGQSALARSMGLRPTSPAAKGSRSSMTRSVSPARRDPSDTVENLAEEIRASPTTSPSSASSDKSKTGSATGSKAVNDKSKSDTAKEIRGSSPTTALSSASNDKSKADSTAGSKTVNDKSNSGSVEDTPPSSASNDKSKSGSATGSNDVSDKSKSGSAMRSKAVEEVESQRSSKIGKFLSFPFKSKSLKLKETSSVQTTPSSVQQMTSSPEESTEIPATKTMCDAATSMSICSEDSSKRSRSSRKLLEPANGGVDASNTVNIGLPPRASPVKTSEQSTSTAVNPAVATPEDPEGKEKKTRSPAEKAARLSLVRSYLKGEREAKAGKSKKEEESSEAGTAATAATSTTSSEALGNKDARAKGQKASDKDVADDKETNVLNENEQKLVEDNAAPKCDPQAATESEKEKNAILTETVITSDGIDVVTNIAVDEEQHLEKTKRSKGFFGLLKRAKSTSPVTTDAHTDSAQAPIEVVTVPSKKVVVVASKETLNKQSDQMKDGDEKKKKIDEVEVQDAKKIDEENVPKDASKEDTPKEDATKKPNEQLQTTVDQDFNCDEVNADLFLDVGPDDKVIERFLRDNYCGNVADCLGYMNYADDKESTGVTNVAVNSKKLKLDNGEVDIDQAVAAMRKSKRLTKLPIKTVEVPQGFVFPTTSSITDSQEAYKRGKAKQRAKLSKLEGMDEADERRVKNLLQKMGRRPSKK